MHCLWWYAALLQTSSVAHWCPVQPIQTWHAIFCDNWFFHARHFHALSNYFNQSHQSTKSKHCYIVWDVVLNQWGSVGRLNRSKEKILYRMPLWWAQLLKSAGLNNGLPMFRLLPEQELYKTVSPLAWFCCHNSRFISAFLDIHNRMFCLICFNHGLVIQWGCSDLNFMTIETTSWASDCCF